MYPPTFPQFKISIFAKHVFQEVANAPTQLISVIANFSAHGQEGVIFQHINWKTSYCFILLPFYAHNQTHTVKRVKSIQFLCKKPFFSQHFINTLYLIKQKGISGCPSSQRIPWSDQPPNLSWIRSAVCLQMHGKSEVRKWLEFSEVWWQGHTTTNVMYVQSVGTITPQ